MPLTHLAVAFATAHPDVTSAIIGPRTMDQLEDLLRGAGTTLIKPTGGRRGQVGRGRRARAGA
ncbi:hypothetical protein [Streptomyces aurantiacus]|uniref:hypothetical protein n=1 Tax=Streptomyces aurantiacus TaxID=47760 RepID=UPI001FDEDAC2